MNGAYINDRYLQSRITHPTLLPIKEWPENRGFPGQVNREASRLGDEGSTDPFRTTSDAHFIAVLPLVVVPVLHHTAMQKTHGSARPRYKASN
jgi:hypothetical protein